MGAKPLDMLVAPDSVIAVCTGGLTSPGANSAYAEKTGVAVRFAQHVVARTLTEDMMRAAKAWHTRNLRAPATGDKGIWGDMRALYGGAVGAKWIARTVAALDAPKRAAMSVMPGDVHVDKPIGKVQPIAQSSGETDPIIDPDDVPPHGTATVTPPVDANPANVGSEPELIPATSPLRSGVAIVLPLPASVATCLALAGGLPPDDMHLTLVLLGNAADVFLDTYDANTLRDTLRDWAASMPCVLGEISGIGRFSSPNDAPDACYYSCDSPCLVSHYASLCAQLNAGMWAYSQEHGFTPHITAAYVDKEASTPFDADALAEPLPIMFDRIALWIGDERHEFPFKPAMESPVMKPLRLPPAFIKLNTFVESDDARTTREALAKKCTNADASNVNATPVAVSVIQIAKLGAFQGHHAGPFEFTAAVFDEIIRNFNATANSQIPIDYEHASETMNSDVMQNGAPAIGWLKSLENRGKDGLWGTVEWMDAKAVDYIRSGRYKFFSPAVMFGAVDPVSGKNIGAAIVSGGLTNRPFLDGMAQVTASANGATPDVKLVELNKVVTILNAITALKVTPAHESKIENLHKKLDALIAQYLGDAAVSVSSPEDVDEMAASVIASGTDTTTASATDATMARDTRESATTAHSHEGQTNMGFKEDIAKAMGMDVACSEADISTAVASRMSKMAEMEVAATARLRADALIEVEALAASGRIESTADALSAAIELRVTSPALFSRMHPKVSSIKQDGVRISDTVRKALSARNEVPEITQSQPTAAGKSVGMRVQEAATELMRSQPQVYTTYAMAAKKAVEMVGNE